MNRSPDRMTDDLSIWHSESPINKQNRQMNRCFCVFWFFGGRVVKKLLKH